MIKLSIKSYEYSAKMKEEIQPDNKSSYRLNNGLLELIIVDLILQFLLFDDKKTRLLLCHLVMMMGLYIYIRQQQILQLKMQFTNHKAVKNFETASKSHIQKYSISAISPQYPYSYYDSPTIQKAPAAMYHAAKDHQELIKTIEQKLQRSPIEPLIYGTETPPYPHVTAIDIDNIMMEHRCQIQDLLSELRRLQDLLYESEQLRTQDVHKVRQQYETNNFLQMSNLRQNQNAQAEILEVQIRKLKEHLQQKSDEHKKVETQLARQRFSNESQKQILKEQVKQLIEKKNLQIYELKQENQSKYRKYEQQKDNELTELKYKTDKEILHLNKIIQDKLNQQQKVQNQTLFEYNQKNKTIQRLSLQKQAIEDKYQRRIRQLYNKYQHLKNNFNTTLYKNIENEEDNWKDLHKMFKEEYKSVFALVKNRENELKQKNIQIQILMKLNNVQFQKIAEENMALKDKLRQISEDGLREIELLKVKIALLHENDIKKLKELYDLKLQNSLANTQRLDQDNNKLKALLHEVKTDKYQMKRKHENTVSQLKNKLLKLKLGMSIMEGDFKDKLDNEKSLMLVTSKSFMKEAEAKNSNQKFYEEEIRKLRQLMDLQSRENEHADKAVEQKIMAANNELQRLSNKIINIAKEKQDLQDALQALGKEKDEEIAILRAQLTKLQFPAGSQVQKQLDIIEQLKQDRNKKMEEIAILTDKVQGLQSKMKEIQAQVERFQMENQMIHEEGKKQFHQISESHLKQFKVFYEEKLKRLEDQKNQLKKIIRSQSEQITQLIRKYKELQQGMKEAVFMIKKRSALEEKVVNLGLDNNIIKNIQELLPEHLKNLKN